MLVAEGESPVLKENDRIFRFADARNAASDMADTDVVANIDMDEMFTVLDIDAVNARVKAGEEHFTYEFVFAHDPYGRPSITFRQCKMFDRRTNRWEGIIHELVQTIPGLMSKPEHYLSPDIYKIEHWQNPETNRSGYLRGLALDCYNHRENDRQSHYLARELMWNNRPHSAMREFRRHIAMNRWPAEKAQSMIYVGDCLTFLGKGSEAVRIWQEAYEVEPARREALLRIARHYYHNNDALRASVYAAASLQIPKGDFYANDPGAYTSVPHEILYWANSWKGNWKESDYHLLKALEYDPHNPKYNADASVRMFSYKDVGIDGWMTLRELNWLHDTAKRMNNVLEVGSWKGRSTHALLTGCKGMVTAVDTFKGSKGEDEAHAEAKTEAVYDAFKRNVGEFPNLSICRGDSLVKAKEKEGQKYDMVFIDGEHTYEGVKADINAWRDKAVRVLCGHDYCDAWPGVKKAVNESIGEPDEVAGTIWVKYLWK